MKKRWISLALLLAMVVSLCVPAMAAEEAAVDVGQVENPLFAGLDVPAAQEDETAARTLMEDGSIAADTRDLIYNAPLRAAELLRDAMVARQSSVDLYILVEDDDYWSNSATDNWFAVELFPLAYSQDLAVGSYDGDYLQWSWASYKWSLDTTRSGNGRYAFHVELKYYTTAAEEQAVQQKVTELVESLKLAEQSDLEAYTAIYDYLTENVTPNNDSARYSYTAYGALCQGKAVCQGYATAFYALCREAGLPVRMLYTPASYNPGHAWNIVQLGELWYSVDATWDAATDSHRDWFLLGTDRFETSRNHTRHQDLTTQAFLAAYPTDTADYQEETTDPEPEPEPQVEEDEPYYTDVAKDRWSYHYIQEATALGLFAGVGDNQFAPGMPMSRAMLVAVLWRMEQRPESDTLAPYTDIDRSAYYAKALDWATDAGIVVGVGDNQFAPNAPATREQTVTILYRYQQYRNGDTSLRGDLSAFQDAGSISDFAKVPMAWAVGSGLVSGVSQTELAPQGTTTREQLAKLVVRLY